MKNFKKKFTAFERCAFAVTMILVPVAFGIVAASAASGDGTNAARSQQFELFDLRTFRARVRELRNYGGASSASSVSSEESHPAAEDETTDVEDAVTEVEEVLTIDDLSSTERSTLRNQLRSAACPQEADAAYKALCESLLKGRTPPPMRGLKNPGEK